LITSHSTVVNLGSQLSSSATVLCGHKSFFDATITSGFKPLKKADTSCRNSPDFRIMRSERQEKNTCLYQNRMQNKNIFQWWLFPINAILSYRLCTFQDLEGSIAKRFRTLNFLILISSIVPPLDPSQQCLGTVACQLPKIINVEAHLPSAPNLGPLSVIYNYFFLHNYCSSTQFDSCFKI
jgi:hypothetical protein